jgi:hypothetical protein
MPHVCIDQIGAYLGTQESGKLTLWPAIVEAKLQALSERLASAGKSQSDDDRDTPLGLDLLATLGHSLLERTRSMLPAAKRSRKPSVATSMATSVAMSVAPPLAAPPRPDSRISDVRRLSGRCEKDPVRCLACTAATRTGGIPAY